MIFDFSDCSFTPQTTYITRDIIATDGGNRSTSVDLAVTITNVKNQPPQWEKESYSVVIPENTIRDTPIVVRVHATLIKSTLFMFMMCVVRVDWLSYAFLNLL